MNTTTPSPRMHAKFVIKDHYHFDKGKPLKVKLCKYGRQNHNSWEEGHDIKKYVSNPLCDHWLDYFLDWPDEIPEEWKGYLVFFWGTIYTLPTVMPLAVGSLEADGTAKKTVQPFKYDTQYVRCLVFSQGVWKCDYLDLNDEFGPTRVSAEIDTKRNIFDWFKRVWARLLS